MNDDLISRSELKKEIASLVVNGESRIYAVMPRCGGEWVDGIASAYREIDNAPTVDIKPFVSITFDKDELDRITNERVIEPIKNGELVIKEKRPTGHWIIEECSLGKTYYCSECYAHPEVCFDFCPYCGADMRGDKE